MKFKVTIPEPCHEDWNKMTPTQKGKFCNACNKDVLDFTFKSNTQIANILANNDAVCGRFRRHQLNTELSTKSTSRLPYWPLAFGFTSLVALCTPVEAQEQKETIEQVQYLGAPALVQKQSTTFPSNIKGTVLDETNLPLPGATVILKGTTYGTVTDFDGNFELEIPEEKRNLNTKVEISYVGYKNNIISIKDLETSSKIILNQSEDVLLGESVVIGGAFTIKKPTIFRRFLNLFKRKHSSIEEEEDVEACELTPTEIETDLPNLKAENDLEKSKIVIWPNPASEQLYLEFNLPSDGEYTLSLLPVNRPFTPEILLDKGYKKAGTLSEILELPNVPNGVYVLKLKTNGFEKQQKIIVEKN